MTETATGCTPSVDAVHADPTILAKLSASGASTTPAIDRSAILESWDWPRSSGRRAP
jgi:hypothetical protein